MFIPICYFLSAVVASGEGEGQSCSGGGDPGNQATAQHSYSSGWSSFLTR